MPQGALPFQYAEENTSTGMTALSGLPAYVDMAEVSGLVESVRTHMNVKKGDQGWTDAQMVMSVNGGAIMYLRDGSNAGRRRLKTGPSATFHRRQSYPVEGVMDVPGGTVSARCGGSLLDQTVTICSPGLSPRVRGIPPGGCPHRSPLRSIPACAGDPTPPGVRVSPV